MQNIGIFGFSLYEIFYAFFVYSFMGWALETMIVSIEEKRLVNRGFFYGPLCPIYGVAMNVIVLALYPVRGNIIFLFLGGMIIATVVEYLTSLILEKMFNGMRWWDYSSYRFNINGRVSLVTSIAWGFLAAFMVRLMHPLLIKGINAILQPIGKIILSIMLIGFVIDAIFSIIVAIRLSKRFEAINEILEETRQALAQSRLYVNIEKSRFSTVLRENIEEVRIKAQQTGDARFLALGTKLDELKLKYEQTIKTGWKGEKRLFDAFPHMRSIRKIRFIDEIREYIKRKK